MYEVMVSKVETDDEIIEVSLSPYYYYYYSSPFCYPQQQQQQQTAVEDRA